MNINENADAIEKSWGESSPLYNDPHVELSRIVVEQGGCCSRHKHLHKNNAFLVVRGHLLLTFFYDGEAKERVLTPGEGICVVAAGVEHRFKALEENTVAYEFYYGEHGRAIDPADIIRLC